ncbi:hypothetical protein ACWKSR_11900, partial [Campylobacter fetus subsp. venerealis]
INAEIDTYDPEGLLLTISRRRGETEEPNGGKELVNLPDIVYLNVLDEGFWSRLSANVDFGWSLTRANNLKQLNVRSGLGYLADLWKI